MGRNKLSVEDIENNQQFELLMAIELDNIVPFIESNFRRRNSIIHLFVIVNLILLTLSSIQGISYYSEGTISLGFMFLFWFLGAIAGSTLIIPLHEFLHGIVYYLMGAPKVNYGMNLSQFYFYAVADRFVIGYAGMWPLALTPFIVVTSLALWAIPEVGVTWKCFLWGLINMHSLNCLGDFAILSYFFEFRKQNIFSFDKVEESTFYIYKEVV